MRFTLTCLILICLLNFTIAQDCESGYYGQDCLKFCSQCKYHSCDENGKCSYGEADGYWSSGDLKGNPICFGKRGCDEGGECIAPNYCICGKAGNSIVGMQANWSTGIQGAPKEFGTNCIHLRKDGLKGALFALVIMVFAIGTCGSLAPTAKNVFRYAKDYQPAEDRIPMRFRKKLAAVVSIFVIVWSLLYYVVNMYHEQRL